MIENVMLSEEYFLAQYKMLKKLELWVLITKLAKKINSIRN